MAREIERKFLLRNDLWRSLGKGEAYCQGYLAAGKDRTVRVRTVGDRGYLTIKGPTIAGAKLEFEYPIPVAEAREMLRSLCLKPLIEKTRYRVPFASFIWEIDEFKGENAGLILAEIELRYQGQDFPMPPWIGREVTDDHRYYNASLISNPYCNWSGEQAT